MLAAVLPHAQTATITRTDKLTKLMVISVNFTLLWVFFRPLKLHSKLKIQVLHVFQTITHLKEIEVKFHQYHFKMSLKSGCQRKPGKMLKMSTEGGQQN